jgi:hypothetical protein
MPSLLLSSTIFQRVLFLKFRILVLGTIGVFLVQDSPCGAPSHVEPLMPWAWSQNTGWLNFSGDGEQGVRATPHHLSGTAWSPNVGWISLGDGTPESGDHYTNTTASDFGVNLDGHGNLSGYAWGQNIGWIRFEGRAGPPGAAALLTPAGAFYGYAWGQNIGWIRLDCDWGVLLTDRDEDGLADAFETATGRYAGPMIPVHNRKIPTPMATGFRTARKSKRAVIPPTRPAIPPGM